MGSVKDRNGMDLTEAEDIKKRWQEYTEELYKKDLHDPDNHDGVIIHLEPDILEWAVKWAWGSITINKATGGDGIPAELFQILKDDAVKVLHSICQQMWENSAMATGLEKVSFHSNPKERQCQRMFKLLPSCTHLTRQQSNAQNSPSQASTVHELWNSRCSNWIYKRQRNQRSNCQHLWGHRKIKRITENIYFCFIDYTKAFDYVDHNKLWKILQEMEIPDHLTCLLRNLYAGQEATIRTEQQTGSKLGKGGHQSCILSPCLFNFYAEYIMQNAGLDEA